MCKQERQGMLVVDTENEDLSKGLSKELLLSYILCVHYC